MCQYVFPVKSRVFSRDDTYQWIRTSSDPVQLVSNSWQQAEHVYSREYTWKHVLVERYQLWTSMTPANWFRNCSLFAGIRLQKPATAHPLRDFKPNSCLSFHWSKRRGWVCIQQTPHPTGLHLEHPDWLQFTYSGKSSNAGTSRTAKIIYSYDHFGPSLARWIWKTTNPEKSWFGED